MAKLRMENIRFCNYGEFGVREPLKRLRGLRKVTPEHNPKLTKRLAESKIANIVADRTAAERLKRLDMEAYVMHVPSMRATDRDIYDLAYKIRGYAVLFHPRRFSRSKTVFFIADAGNITILKALNGGKKLVTFNSPFEPGRVISHESDFAGVRVKMTREERRRMCLEEGLFSVPDSVSMPLRDFFELYEIPVPAEEA